MTKEGPVAVIGLGLIGGSITRDLHARGIPVLGADARAENLRLAAAEGCITPVGADLAELRDASLVVIATPVDVALELLPQVARAAGPEAIVTDTGSTKRAIVGAAEQAGIAERFVGSHPLAGHHHSGWKSSVLGLFMRERVYLAPTAATREESVASVAAFWERLGALPQLVDASAHDELLGWTSHLPQLVSSALAASLARAGVPHAALGPGGRDMTRLAGSDPAMWTAIAGQNAEVLREALEAFAEEIAALRESLEDPGALRERLEAGKGWTSSS